MRPRRDQDDVDTDVLGVVRVAISDPAAKNLNGAKDHAGRAPRTQPITVRPDTRSRAQRRTEQLLNVVILGGSSHLKLWDHLTKQWGLAPTDLAERRWRLYQAVLTQVAEAETEWTRATPTRCGAGPRTPLTHCTARDTCSRHRDHLGLWQDALERFTDYLHDALPAEAAKTVDADPRKTRRRTVQS